MKHKTAKNYIEVLKPRASILLTFIGICAAIIAGDGQLSPYLLLIAFTILAEKVMIVEVHPEVLAAYIDNTLEVNVREVVLFPRDRHRLTP